MIRWLLCVVIATAWPAWAQQGPQVTTEEPRAFGYQVGDLVTRVVLVHLPRGWTLDEGALPVPGRLSTALDLRSLEQRQQTFPEGRRVRIELTFQVFAAPAAARLYELPGLTLRVEGGQGTEEALRVDPWPLVVAPVGLEDASPRQGLGAMRPDPLRPTVDTSRLKGVVVGALSLAGTAACLAWVCMGRPGWRHRQRPFALAWDELRPRGRRARPDGDAGDGLRIARRLHVALNASAGQVLFAEGLDEWLARVPAYVPLREDLQRFFQQSSSSFFAAAPLDARWMLTLARALRDAERSAG